MGLCFTTFRKRTDLKKEQVLKNDIRKFKLNEEFLEPFKEITPKWGPLGEFVFYRTYSRTKPNGTKEAWWETCKRVVETTYDVQIDWLYKNHLYKNRWNWFKAQVSAQEMYTLIFNFLISPPGRGLWAMTSEIIKRKKGAALNNCSFTSTEKITKSFASANIFMADMSMLGIGVGFDTKGKDKVEIKRPPNTTDVPFVVKDSREGWLELINVVLLSLAGREGAEFPLFRDYSEVRGIGELIKGFGGTASGPSPLEILIQDLVSIFGYSMKVDMNYQKNEIDIKRASSYKLIQKIYTFPFKVDSLIICDIMNAEGKCVVSGNVRRSSQISLGDPDDELFINRKNIFKKENQTLEASKKIAETYPTPQYALHHLQSLNRKPEVKDFEIFGPKSWRWCSNNSIIATVGMDYSKFVDIMVETGEPGFFWLKNARAFGRTKDAENWKDKKAKGCNPCSEMTLEDRELCNVVEAFISKFDTLAEFLRGLKKAYLYAKTISLIPTHHEETNAVLLKNRRIGVSLTGVTKAIAKLGYREFVHWIDEGYKYLQELDAQYSDWFCVPRSRKMTTIKPGGTVPLLSGEPSGVRFPYAEYYIRRVRVAANSPYVSIYQKAGYIVEQDSYDPTSFVIDFPVHEKHILKTEAEATVWEQLEIVRTIQRYWSDNQVSVTIKFYPHEIKDIKTALPMFEEDLKSLSFLPQEDHGYKQAPYQRITETQYHEMTKDLKPVDIRKAVHEIDDKFCDGEKCEIPIKKEK